MSPGELEARIEDLSAVIDRQKQVLANLEKNKITLQRQLNAVRDPVAQLPLEISSEIFLQCLPSESSPLKPGAGDIPMLLLNICSAWTDIALSIPGLWAAIRVDFPRAEGFDELLRTWLKRARHHSLSIFLHNTGLGVDKIVEIVSQHFEQVESLELHVDYRTDIFLPTIARSASALQMLTVGARYSQPVSAFRLLCLLRLAPNLRECTFVNVFASLDGVETPLVLPHLAHLTIELRFEENGSRADNIFRNLTLPSLKSLHLHSPNRPEDLLLFLERSSPPLEKLHIILWYSRLPLTRFLRLVPTIAQLALHGRTDIDMKELFSALAEDTTGTFLPTLRNLTLRFVYGPDASTLPAPVYPQLLRALSRRHRQMLSVELIWKVEPSKPATDICIAFRELIADGMAIHIGTEDHNLLLD